MALVELHAGHDSFAAQALSDICRDEGVDVDLILATDPYVGMDHTTPHRIVVSADDVPAVEQIVADRFPQLRTPDSADPVESVASLASFRRRPVRFAVAMMLVCVTIVPLIGFGVALFIDVLETLT